MESNIIPVKHSKGFYDEQDPVFRGCAGNYFPHDQKCTTQQQVGLDESTERALDKILKAVTIVEGKKSVDVEVELCYCNEELCNTKLSASITLHHPGVITLISIATISWKMP